MNVVAAPIVAYTNIGIGVGRYDSSWELEELRDGRVGTTYTGTTAVSPMVLHNPTSAEDPNVDVVHRRIEEGITTYARATFRSCAAIPIVKNMTMSDCTETDISYGSLNVTQHAKCRKYIVTRVGTGFEFRNNRSHISIKELRLRTMDFTITLNFLNSGDTGYANYLFTNGDHSIYIRDNDIYYRYQKTAELLLYSGVDKTDVHNISMTVQGTTVTTWLDYSDEVDSVLPEAISYERELILGNNINLDRRMKGSLNYIYVISRPLKVSQIKAMSTI